MENSFTHFIEGCHIFQFSLPTPAALLPTFSGNIDKLHLVQKPTLKQYEGPCKPSRLFAAGAFERAQKTSLRELISLCTPPSRIRCGLQETPNLLHLILVIRLPHHFDLFGPRSTRKNIPNSALILPPPPGTYSQDMN